MRVAYFPDFSGFLKLYLVTGFKKCVKLTFSIFKENSHYAEIGLNMTFLDLKSILLNCSPNLLLNFSETVCDGRHEKVGERDCFGFLRRILIMPVLGF